jgi:serine/threonine protein kinase
MKQQSQSVYVPAPGDVITDRYALHDLLGGGGIGVVFGATDTRLGREVAVKLLRPQYSQRKDSRARFEREARVASQLHHPNAVNVFDFGEHNGALYLVMERLIGTTTWHQLHAPPTTLPVARVVDVIRAVADVLAAAHAIQLVHRDLKPDNIFLERSTDAERIVVVDFGMAFIAEAADDGTGRLTEEGLAGGTPDYMSPEQASDSEVGPAADIYTLGCVTFELLTGSPPYRGNIPQLLSAHLYMPAPSAREVRPDVPAELEALLQHMMTKAPSKRPTAKEVRDRLGEIVKSLPRTSNQPAERSALAAARTEDRNLSRAERMVAAPINTDAPTHVDVVATPQCRIAVIGEASEELLFTFANNNLLATHTSWDSIPTDAAAVYAPGAALHQLERLIGAKLPVITDARAGDMTRITSVLRLGVAEVALTPLRNDEVARKVLRAIHKKRTQ